MRAVEAGDAATRPTTNMGRSDPSCPAESPDYREFKTTLAKQLADLESFEAKGIKPDPYFGDIPHARWFNLHLWGYLEGGLAGMAAHRKFPDTRLDVPGLCGQHRYLPPDWTTLGEFLELCRLYE
ncbi:hypothetical protein HYR69_00110 [Candidatus Sumerlaeota bacterium]|nr:hypothetical protein [Candidatus Sumerlaeota bacterium]